MFNRTAVHPLLLSAVCGLACSLAPSLRAEPPKQGQPPAPDALRGPEVRDRQVPGVEGSFGQPGGERKRLVNENRLPPRVFRDAMETVLSPEAPEHLRVSDEQRTKYRSWMDDFQKSVAAYMKEHATELQELRRKAGEPGRPGPKGGRPEGDAQNKPRPDEMQPEADAKETGAARERLQTIMQGAPKIEDLYTKIWTELTPDQQKAVDERLQEFRDRQAKEREDRYVQQKLSKKKGEPGKPPAPRPDDKPQPRPGAADRFPDASGPQGGPIDPQRRDRLMRLFSRLTPEQQEQLLQRLERARAEDGDNAPPARRRGGANRPPDRSPAPAPDDAMVPPPPKPPEGQP